MFITTFLFSSTVDNVSLLNDIPTFDVGFVNVISFSISFVDITVLENVPLIAIFVFNVEIELILSLSRPRSPTIALSTFTVIFPSDFGLDVSNEILVVFARSSSVVSDVNFPISFPSAPVTVILPSSPSTFISSSLFIVIFFCFLFYLLQII